jgi:predicted flap endonuclease-1-like 5' DNA nuclease
VSDPVGKIRGITVEVETSLKAASIADIDQLLQAGCDPASRKALAAKLSIDTKALLELLNRADLARIRGIGTAFANLLEESGVDTVKELANRVPANLHAKLVELNAEKKLAHHVPPLTEIEAWVKEAKELPKILTY